MIDRPPQWSEPAEQAVLGACLQWPEALDDVVAMLQPADFYSTLHGQAFAAVLSLYSESQPVEAMTVAERMRSQGVEVGPRVLNVLNDLVGATATRANVDGYARIVADKARVRAAIDAAKQTLYEAYDSPQDVSAWLSGRAAALDAVMDRADEGAVIRIGESVGEALTALDRDQKAKRELIGISTGFSDLDSMLGGLQPGGMYILAARPGVGKSQLMLDVARFVARRWGPVLIESIEMGRQALLRRSLASMSGVSSGRLLMPKRLTPDDMGKLLAAGEELKRLPIYLDVSRKVNVVQIRTRARRLHRKGRLALVCVDYLQIMDPLQTLARVSREQQVSSDTRALRAIAGELDVPFLVLSQLNRGPEARQDKRPQLQDLRESGAIEQDADAVMFLYRESAINPDCGHDLAEIIVGKNRDGGQLGTVDVRYDGESSRYVPLSIDMVSELRRVRAEERSRKQPAWTRKRSEDPPRPAEATEPHWQERDNEPF